MLATLRSQSPAVQLSVLLGSVYFYIGFFAPFYPLWLSARGLKPGDVGLVLAAPMIVRIFSNPVILSTANRFRAVDQTMVLCGIASLAGFIGLVFCHSFWPLFLVTGFTFIFQGSMMPLSDVMILDEVARDQSLHYGYIRSWGSVAVLVGMLIAGALAGILPGEAVIWMLVLCAILQALMCVTLLSGRKSVPQILSSKAGQTQIRRLDLVILVIIAAALVQSSHAFISGFGPLLYRAQGHSDLFIGWSWATGVFTEILMFMVAGRYLGGPSNSFTFFVVGSLSAVVRWLVSSFDFGSVGIVLTQSSHGLTFCATHLGTMYLLARMVPPSRLAQVQGAYAGVNSLLTALMTAASGLLYQNIAAKGLLVMMVPAFIGFLIIFYVSRVVKRG